MRSLSPPVLTVALLLGLSAAHAQEPRLTGVRIISVKATEVQGEPPPLPPDLARWADVLQAVRSAPTRYESAGERAIVRLAPGGPAGTLNLPREHQALVTTTERPDGRIGLRVEITRPSRQRPGERERVLVHEVAAEDGASYVVRVGDCFERGTHLLLIITASAGPLD